MVFLISWPFLIPTFALVNQKMPCDEKNAFYCALPPARVECLPA